MRYVIIAPEEEERRTVFENDYQEPQCPLGRIITLLPYFDESYLTELESRLRQRLARRRPQPRLIPTMPDNAQKPPRAG